MDARRRQLNLVHEPNDRDEFIVGELDELERNIVDRLDKSQADIKNTVAEFKQEYTADLAELRKDLKERDAQTNKRITAMQGMLVGAMASTTVAAIVGMLNILVR